MSVPYYKVYKSVSWNSLFFTSAKILARTLVMVMSLLQEENLLICCILRALCDTRNIFCTNPFYVDTNANALLMILSLLQKEKLLMCPIPNALWNTRNRFCTNPFCWHQISVGLLSMVLLLHYSGIIMSAMASQITGVSIVYSTVFVQGQIKQNIKALETSEFSAPREKNEHLMTSSWLQKNQ